MNAGELTERITVESPTTASDGMGGQTVTWSTSISLWAKVRPVKGREMEHLGRLVSAETYLVVTHYNESVSTTDRIIWRGKTMNVRSSQDRDGDRRWLTIEAEVGLGS